MKIAFYNPTHLTFLSGAEIVLLNMLPLIVEEGHEVTLYMTSLEEVPANSSVVKELKNTGVKIIQLKSFSLPLSGSPIPVGFLLQLGARYDFFYVFNGFAFQDFFGLILSKIFRAKFVYGIIAPMMTRYHLHNIYQSTVAKLIIRKADMVHTLNRDDCESLGLINKKVFFVGFGLKKEFLLHDVPEERLKSKALNVIFVGRLCEQKGVLRLLKVIEQMSGNIAIKFFICGDGEYRTMVEEYSAKLPNLTYLGFAHKKLSEVFKDKHVFLNLSKYETFCLTVLEALANGLPVIATATSGVCKDYGDDMLFAKISNDSQINEIKAAIERMASIFKNQKDEYNKMAKRAIKKASFFVWEDMTSSFIKHFTDELQSEKNKQRSGRLLNKH